MLGQLCSITGLSAALYYVAAKSYMELWQLNCFFLFFFGSVFFHPIHFDDCCEERHLYLFKYPLFSLHGASQHEFKVLCPRQYIVQGFDPVLSLQVYEVLVTQ